MRRRPPRRAATRTPERLPSTPAPTPAPTPARRERRYLHGRRLRPVSRAWARARRSLRVMGLSAWLPLTSRRRHRFLLYADPLDRQGEESGEESAEERSSSRLSSRLTSGTSSPTNTA